MAISDKELLELNMDKTVVRKGETARKPRGETDYVFDSEIDTTPSFGMSLYLSLLKGFSSIFEYENLPEYFDKNVFEMFLNQAGRMKIIRVGTIIIPVHITPTSFDHYGNWVTSVIVEPYLPLLTGLDAEIFPAVQFKNNVLGRNLISQIFPFLTVIDEALFSLDINMRTISGKLVFLTENLTTTEDSTELEDAVNQWFTDGKPIKVMEKSPLSDDGNPIRVLDIKDYTDSFIQTIRFNISQMLNVLGIPNDNFEDKKERKITSEINVQNILQSSIIEDMFNERLKSVEELNRVFGTNVIVKVKDVYMNTEEQVEELDNVEEV